MGDVTRYAGDIFSRKFGNVSLGNYVGN